MALHNAYFKCYFCRMQLGKFSDYGLRVLIHLAVLMPGRASAAQIARAFDISEHHLAKVCSLLVRDGFLISERGRNGGLSLAKAPQDISIGDALRCLTAQTALVECFSTNPCDCRILPVCGLKDPLAKAQNAFLTTLEAYSLADVIKGHRNELALLLQQQS